MTSRANVIPIRRAPARDDSAYRATISTHCPNQDEMQIAARVEIAILRDKASAGIARASDEAAGMLSEVARLASVAVYAPWPASRLLKIRMALWMAMEAARGVERVARDA